MKKRKMYKEGFNSVWLTIIMAILLIVVLVFSAIDSPMTLIILAPIFLACIGVNIAILVIYKLAVPIYINDEELTYRNERIKWEDVRITIYPLYCRRNVWIYCMLFSDKYLKGEDLRQAYKKGFYITFLSRKDVRFILENYKHKFSIVENNGYVEAQFFYDYSILSRMLIYKNKYYDEAIYEHNEKYEDWI